MRATDHRYAGEMAKFNLAVRMIGHEARTGTIRSCTGFSEDRIRKIYKTYFRNNARNTIKRRRGKSPRQITPFLSSSLRQSEATILACLFLYCGILKLDETGALTLHRDLDPLGLGERMCNAYETYRALQPEPELCFERTWTLYHAIVSEHELVFARCNDCGGPYIQDRYALDYKHCPFCDIKQGKG